MKEKVKTFIENKNHELPVCGFEKLFHHPALSHTFLEFPLPLSENIATNIQHFLQTVSFQHYPKLELMTLEKSILDKFVGSGKNKQVILYNGGFQAIDSLISLISMGENFRVLMLNPDFYAFKTSCIKHNVLFDEFFYNDNFSLDIDKLLTIIEEKSPDLIMLSNPNNPLGTALSKDTIRKIISHSSGLVLIDETYALFSEESAMDLLNEFDNLLILGSFSKIGFAAIRLGFLAGNQRIIGLLKKMSPPFPINSLSIGIGNIVIDHFHEIEKSLSVFKALRTKMIAELKKIKEITLIESQTNFILVQFNLDLEKIETLYNKLLSQNILVRNFLHPQHTVKTLNHCLRFSVLSEAENIDTINCLKAHLS